MLLPLILTLPIATNTHWEDMLAESVAAQNRASAAHFSQLPVDGVITGQFGKRPHPILNLTRKHRGLDIAAEEGTPFHTTATGIVKFAGEAGTLGNLIVIDHGSVVTRYAHAQSIHVEPGQHVRAGQVIGTVGQTGLATGPHLHFEVILEDRHQDPLAFMSQHDFYGEPLQGQQDWIASMISAPSNSMHRINSNMHESLMDNILGKLDAQILALLEHQFSDANYWDPDYAQPSILGSTQHQSDKIITTSATLWSLALDYTHGTDFDVYQGMMAIYENNKDAFYDNLNLRRSDKPLRLPPIETLDTPCSQGSRERFYNDLKQLSSNA